MSKASKNFIDNLPQAILLTTLSFTAAVSQAHEKAAEDEFGAVDFEVGCKPETQVAFNRALAQLHNMMYLEAEQMFNEAALTDPECAMLHWGVAMSNFHPLWPGGQNKSELERGTVAVNKAIEIGSDNPREAAYINAVAAMYDETGGAYNDRKARWAELQKAVHERFPEDEDATAFFALSHISVAPKADKSLANQKTAGQILEKLHKEYPSHPAGFHYLIHAYDNPLLANKAEAVSRAYDKIAPSVPHALHMPSHIFVRMGLWEETVFWNDRSAQAALEQAGEITTSHYAHAIDYKIYAHLQRGEHKIAADDLAQVNAVTNHQSSFGSAYGLAASDARLPLETEDWAAAAKLTARNNSSIDWNKFPAAESITYFAKGIGAARNGDIGGAKAAIDSLAALRDQMKTNGPAYWAIIADSQHKSVSAWLAFAQGDKANAEALMMAAADIEDSVDKSPVTPGAVLPARELYGDMLGLLGKHNESLDAYEAALGVSPNRTRSMLGAMRAAKEAGNSEKYELYRQAVEEQTASNGWMNVPSAQRSEG